MLDRDRAPLKGAQPPNFRPMSVVAKRLDGLRCHLVRRKTGPGHIVFDGDPTPSEIGAVPLNFRPTRIVAKRSPIAATAGQRLKHELTAIREHPLAQNFLTGFGKISWITLVRLGVRTFGPELDISRFFKPNPAQNFCINATHRSFT